VAFTFVAAVNDQSILINNLMASPCFRGPHPHQILIQTGFQSAASAYNDAMTKSVNDVVIFVHQDMLFPEAWPLQLERSLQFLDRTNPDWGVLGCYGETLHGGGRGYVYSGSLGLLGQPFDEPVPIQTLDEIVLVLRLSRGLKFDEGLPNFHFYGADICMEAASRGLRSYAISALCIHNAQINLVLPKEFYDCCSYLRKKWKSALPIQTTCVRITSSGLDMYMRRLREAYLRFIRRKTIGSFRVKDGRELLARVENATRKVVGLDRENVMHGSK
jgi:hypothetical protein